MLKIYEPNLNVVASGIGNNQEDDPKKIVLRKQIRRNWSTEGKKIIKIYHYMYRFSINKLHQFKRDSVLINLFDFYFQNYGSMRIRESKTMRTIPETYREAALNITQDLHLTERGNYNQRN
jgi:hypothetical protein